MIYSITLTLIIIAMYANAIMDLSAENRFRSPYWNKAVSSENKYMFIVFGRMLPVRYHKDWIAYLLRTAFVFVTDGWHLAQFVFHTAWQMAIAVNMEKPVLAFIVIKVIFSGLFETIYSSMKEKLR